jgi:hypothetical protein
LVACKRPFPIKRRPSHTICMSRFILQAIDPATESIATEATFETSDILELCTLAGIDGGNFPLNRVVDLDPAAVEKITKRYGVTYDAQSVDTVLAPWHPIDELPYRVHTDRELALMLAGKKPLSAFSEAYPSLDEERGLIPERAFQTHVDSGRIIKREHLFPPNENSPKLKGQPLGTRCVLYALPGEEWRIDAYLLLWKTAEKVGWGEGFERLEGSLLGYEDWQNDAFIDWQKQRKQAAVTDKAKSSGV